MADAETSVSATWATAVNATLAGYDAAYWWGAGVFLLGAVIAALLFARHSRGAAAEPATEGAVSAPVL